VSDEKARREYLATLRDESDHLSRVVENVLTYARVEQGRLIAGDGRGRRERMTADDLIATTTARIVERARRAGAAITIDVPNGSAAATGKGDAASHDVASLVVETDPGAVEQIIGNIVDNAIKYACPIDPRIEIKVSHDAASNMLCLSVADHGPGIEQKDADAIFQPFVRGSRQDRCVQGVGLGLAISRQLAKDLGGDLRLCPRKAGKGAEFVVTLPISA